MLEPRGVLVSYGTASSKDLEGSSRLPLLKLIGRLMVWNALPNGKRATFFHVWAGRRNRVRFQADLREDLGQDFELLRQGALHPQVAATFPLTQIAKAMRLAESKTVVGKVVLVPCQIGQN